jgi:hypothetical protein
MKRAPSEKHRTEVTEATEGGLGLGDPLFVNIVACERELCDSEQSIAQRSQTKRRKAGRFSNYWLLNREF